MRYSHRDLVGWVVNFFVTIAVGLLALRVLLRFFNGNPDAAFVHWVYTSTNTLLEPFRGIFTSSGVLDRGWVIDYTALFAMAVYALAGYVVLSIADFWARRK
ncbi:MAG: YggT family protein [Candidatus Saccharimonadales bacterium]